MCWVMLSCCWYNGSGGCLNYVFAKADTPCTDCLPHQWGRCMNHAAPVPGQPGAYQHCTDSNSNLNSHVSGPDMPLHGAAAINSSPALQLPHSSQPRDNALLPSFTPIVARCFMWGDVDAEMFTHSITSAYMLKLWIGSTISLTYFGVGREQHSSVSCGTFFDLMLKP